RCRTSRSSRAASSCPSARPPRIARPTCRCGGCRPGSEPAAVRENPGRATGVEGAMAYRPPSVFVLAAALLAVAGACTGPVPATPGSLAPASAAPTAEASGRPTPPARDEGNGELPVLVGDPIDIRTLPGTIVFDDYEDLFTMRADATGLRRLT